MAEFPRGRVFGTWDAPATDDDIPIDTPVGETCVWCQEKIREGDNGRIAPAGHVEHRECCLRQSFGGIGHNIDHERYCHGELGPDAGLSHRASALLVWNWFHLTKGGQPTPDQLEYWKRVLEILVEGRN